MQEENFRSCRMMSLREKQKYVETFDFQYIDLIGKYEKVAKIGQGTFGEVFKARDRTNPSKFIAMKRIFMDNEIEGFPITALREIRILQRLKDNNIVRLLEICRTKPTALNKFRSAFYLIFEFCEHDLAGLLANRNVKFSLAEIKKVMHQLFSGLYFMHTNNILHRDLKAANVLITKQGILKLADFGLARAFSVMRASKRPNRFTNRVVTLWYRPPELLLGERDYGPPIDLWGAGCIMAEMWTRIPILQGGSEQMQLTLISQLCGSITSKVWPEVAALPLYSKMELVQNKKRRVVERLKPFIKDAHALDLVDKLLTLDPSQRITANLALDHDFFWTDPMPCELTKMLAQHNQSMFEFLCTQQGRRGGGHPPNQQQQPAEANAAQELQAAAEAEYHDRTY